jgi:CelD/BcsL family acetyltransferase involved in cellulose biosynthesis
MADVVHIDPSADPRWTAFVEEHPRAMVFHHPAWMAALLDTYGYEQCSLLCTEGQEVLGIVPLLGIASRLTGRRGVCLPFSDYGYPLFRRASGLDALLDACLQLKERKRWAYVELRGMTQHPAAKPSARYKVHRLDLTPGPDTLFKGFTRGGTQAAIKQCARFGVRIERRTDPEAVALFRRLNYQTRKKHGIPPQPDRFFDAIHRHLIARGMGFVSIAIENGRPIAASVFLSYRGTLYHKFNASDEEALRFRPNHGILWDATQWGCANGYHTLDMGRSDLDGEGLLKYKRSWGTTESDLTYVRFTDQPTEIRTGEGGALSLLNPVLRHTPVPLLKALGNFLYEHVA